MCSKIFSSLFYYYFIFIFIFIFIFFCFNLESRSKVLSASQIVGAAPDGYSHVDTDRHSDSTKEGNVQTHKGYMGKTITTGNEIKPKLEKKKGIVFYYFLLLIPIIGYDDDVSHILHFNSKLN